MIKQLTLLFIISFSFQFCVAESIPEDNEVSQEVKQATDFEARSDFLVKVGIISGILFFLIWIKRLQIRRRERGGK